MHPATFSNDIIGLQLYIPTGTVPVDWNANSRNLSAYVSPTSVYRNGSLCVSAYSPTANGPVPNNVTCPTLSNARYVTIERYVSSSAPSLGMMEVQILRSGAASGAAG